jgi:hypothetical protein
MFTVRVDPHVHLYDTYPIETWSKAAVDNLGVTDSIAGVAIVVDRAGQDSFARLRAEAGVDAWEEARGEQLGSHTALAAVLNVAGKRLYVIRGVQYVSAEKLEVLGLGVARSSPDGRSCRELITLIKKAGGVAYMPWSPGKWLGPRGLVIKQLIRELAPSELVFGDIAIHSRFLLPSSLLDLAREAGFGVIPGTDPLPRAQDAGLVGTYGVELELENRVELGTVAPSIITKLSSRSSMLRVWGQPNSLFRAARRFVSTL